MFCCEKELKFGQLKCMGLNCPVLGLTCARIQHGLRADELEVRCVFRLSR